MHPLGRKRRFFLAFFSLGVYSEIFLFSPRAGARGPLSHPRLAWPPFPPRRFACTTAASSGWQFSGIVPPRSSWPQFSFLDAMLSSLPLTPNLILGSPSPGWLNSYYLTSFSLFLTFLLFFSLFCDNNAVNRKLLGVPRMRCGAFCDMFGASLRFPPLVHG